MKAQVSLEYIFIMGIVLLGVTPLFYYALTELQTTIKVHQADETVQVLAKTADYVYALGEGNAKIVQVSLPSDVKSFDAYYNEVGMTVGMKGGDSYIEAFTIANVSSHDLPTSKGSHYILLNMTGDTVNLTQATGIK